MGVKKRQSVTPVHLLDEGSNLGRRVRLTRKTRPVALVSHDADPGHPMPRRWKRLRPPSSEGEGGEVGVPRNLFLRLGVGGEVCAGDAWNLPSQGTGVLGRRDWRTCASPFLISCIVRARGQTSARGKFDDYDDDDDD